MLNEVGFQANQHEILADNFSKEQYRSVHEAAKRLKEQKKRNMKEADKIGAELKQVQIVSKNNIEFLEQTHAGFEQEENYHVFEKS